LGEEIGFATNLALQANCRHARVDNLSVLNGIDAETQEFVAVVLDGDHDIGSVL
jgi:hypothetical protein